MPIGYWAAQCSSQRYGDILKSSVNANNLFVCCVYVEPTLVGKMGALPMVTVVMVGEVVRVVAHSTSAGYNECDWGLFNVSSE